MCVCGISVWFIYLFVRCQSLSHIPNSSLQCSNQSLWKLNLMTGVNTTKQQTGEIKNTIKSNLVELNKVRKQPQSCSGKKDVLINSFSESCLGKFSVKILEKYLWRSSFLVKLHSLVPGSFNLRKKPQKTKKFLFGKNFRERDVLLFNIDGTNVTKIFRRLFCTIHWIIIFSK